MSIYLLDTIDSLSVNNLSASNLANVAYSGSFNDLSDVPEAQSLSLPTSANWDGTYTIVQNNSATWSSAGTSNFNGQYSALANTPSFNQVAFDGAYSSLSGLPDSLSLPTSGTWDSTYTTVLANSATWSSVGSSNFNGQYSALEGVPSNATFSSSVSAPVVFTSTIKGDGSWNGYSDPTYLGSIEIVPNENLYGQGQYLKIRPTSNFDEQHIHIESGLYGDLVLGNDDFYYKLNGHARLSDNNYHNLAEIGVSEKNSISTIVNDLFFNGGTLSLNLSSYGWANNLSVGNIINVNGQSLSITTVGNVYYNNDEPEVQVVFYPSVSAAVIPGDSVEFNYKPRKIYSFDSSGNLNLPEGGSIKNNLGNDIINTDWDSTYSTVLANSALWSSVGAINNFNGQYSALANLPSFNQVAFDGAYDSLSGKPQVVTDLIAGQVTGDLLITGALTAAGGVTFNNSVVVTTTSALSVINTGPGPALYIQQGVGSGDIASFYDADGIEALHIGNAKNTTGQDPSGVIGVNTSFPNKTLSVAGEISASQQIWAPVATFGTSVSASALSGVHYGSGSSLTGLLTSNITGFSGSVSALLPVRSVNNKYGNVSLCNTDITFLNSANGINIGAGSWNAAPSQAIEISTGGGSTEQNAVNLGYSNIVRCFSVGVGWNSRVGRDAVLVGRNAGRNTADTTKTYGSVSIGAYAATVSQECLNVAIGHSANQTALDTGCSVAIGYGSTASSWGVTIGTFSTTTSPSAISLGAYTSAVNLGVAIGYGAKANCALGVGLNANVCGTNSIGIGNAVCFGSNAGTAVIMGANACVSNSDGSVLIGSDACINSARSVVIGATACTNASSTDGVAIGHNARTVFAPDGVAIGKTAGACAIGVVAIGRDSNSTGQYAVNVGHSSRAAGIDGGVSVGYKACSNANSGAPAGSVSIGCCSVSTNVALGGSSCSTNYGVAIGLGAVSNCNLAIASASVPISSTTATDFSGRYLPLNLNGTVGVVPVYANTAEFSAAIVRYAPAGSSSTISIPTSANWDSTYTTVQSNSATWGTGGSGGSTQLNISSDYTLVLTDNNNTVRTTTTSASPSLILSIPSYSDVAFPVGAVVTIIQGDTGSITLSATPGVSFVTKEAVKNQTFNKGSVVYAIKTQTDEWVLTGDLGIQGIYFYASSSGFPDNRWYNINSWYGDLNRTLRANILPNSNIDVVILGSIGAYADIDRNDWVQPKSIDTGNTSVTFTSQLSGNISINITGTAIFEGNATYNK